MNTLVIVKPQRDYIVGSMAVGLDKWRKAYQEISRKMNFVDNIVIIKEENEEDSPACSEVKHCIKDTYGTDIYNELKEKLETIIKKDKTKVYYIETEGSSDFENDVFDIVTEINDERINSSNVIFFTGVFYEETCEFAKRTAKTNSDKTIIVIKEGTVFEDVDYNLDLNCCDNIDEA